MYHRNAQQEFRVDFAGGDLHLSTRDPRDDLPDIRDGLTHRERIVLQCLYACLRNVLSNRRELYLVQAVYAHYPL